LNKNKELPTKKRLTAKRVRLPFKFLFPLAQHVAVGRVATGNYCASLDYSVGWTLTQRICVLYLTGRQYKLKGQFRRQLAAVGVKYRASIPG